MKVLKFKHQRITHRGLVSRLLYWYKTSTPENREKGLRWYHEARAFCEQLAEDAGLELPQAVGVVAALSPMVNWDQNKINARKFLIDGKENVHTTAQIDKAYECTDAHSPESIFSLLTKHGTKTSWFFWNILFPDKKSGVTIDRHAIGSCISSPSNVDVLPEGFGNITIGHYTFFMDAHIRAAEIVGILPHQLQAIIWGQYRENRELNAHVEVNNEAPF